MMTRLNFLERFIVIDVLGRVVKIENNFRVAVRQEPIDRVLGVMTLDVHKILDKLTERGIRTVHLKNHFGKRSPDSF